MIHNNNFAKVVAAMAIAPFVANGHMIMASPKPYGSPDKAPLEANGSNFPCKGVAYTGDSNQWPVGSTQTLSWQAGNSAVHGGGSCQISVTTDKNPTASSKWKVIHSIQGGCPYNTVGNLPEDGSTPIPGFPFTVPKELPNGEMSMAWTWFNRIGNREMYMNCAPITVTGGASDTTAFDALPDMAIANIAVPGAATCTTTEGMEYTFANPGQYTTNGMALNAAGGTYPFAPLCGGAAVPAPGGSAPATGAPAASAPAASAPAASAPAASAPAANPPGNKPTATGMPATTMKTVAGAPAQSQAPAKAPPAQSAAPIDPPKTQPTAAPAAPAKNPPTGGNSSGTACPVDGAVVCQGETMFAICDRGQAYFMPVAQGTTCNAGVISKRNPHAHRHLRRSL